VGEYEDDLKLDIYNLHKEWQKQATLYGKWSKNAARASKVKFKADENLKAIRIETKRKLEEKRSEIDSEIRGNWEAFGFEKKPTENAITACIIQQEEYKEVYLAGVDEVKQGVDKLADAIEDEEYLKGTPIAMSHKKAAIGGEVQLWLGEYYSDPNIPKEYVEEIVKKEKKSVRKQLKKKRGEK